MSEGTLCSLEVKGKNKMDNALAEGARKLYAENLFETVRKCYCEANKNYLERQIRIASKYLTEEQKKELRDKGINV